MITFLPIVSVIVSVFVEICTGKRIQHSIALVCYKKHLIHIILLCCGEAVTLPVTFIMLPSLPRCIGRLSLHGSQPTQSSSRRLPAHATILECMPRSS